MFSFWQVWPADVCRGVATDLLVGVTNHRQCCQHTYPKIPPKIGKNSKFKTLHSLI